MNDLTYTILYKLYLEWMNEKYSDQVVATLRQYREIFKTDYNIDFNKPKKDQCPRCDLFKIATEPDKTKLEYEHALHVETLTYPALYRLYVDWMKENRPWEQVANSRQYKDIFYTEDNIEFHKPKKDLCILCNRYNRGTENEKEDMKLEYSLHIEQNSGKRGERHL